MAATSSQAPLPLNVTIVGAGIGGLTTAFLLGRAGHKVTVLERASELREAGAGVQLSPNVTRLLFRWGLEEKLMAVSSTAQEVQLRRFESGDLLGFIPLGGLIEKEHGFPWIQVHRHDLQRMLIELVESQPTISIKLKSKVTEVVVGEGDAPSVTVTLESGDKFESDVLVGADGVHSIVRGLVTESSIGPEPTGSSAYRVLIPIEKILEHEDLREIVERPRITAWMGPNRHVISYPVSSGKLLNMVLMHPSHSTDKKVVDADYDVLKADFADFEPRLRKLIDISTNAIEWCVSDGRPLQTWVDKSGSICLLGDACHPMVPCRAQGAAMAIEDAAVLGALLSLVKNRSEIPQLLKAYEGLRKDRTTTTYLASKMNQKMFDAEDGPQQMQRDMALKGTMEFMMKKAQGADVSGTHPMILGHLAAEKQKNKDSFDYDGEEEVAKWSEKFFA